MKRYRWKKGFLGYSIGYMMDVSVGFGLRVPSAYVLSSKYEKYGRMVRPT